MFFSRLFRRGKPSPRSYKPGFCVLEDRTVPSGFHSWPPPLPGPATHFEVEAPAYVTVGQSFTVEVEALDANNRAATGYAGKVHLSSSTDTLVGLPTDYTFVPLTDQGEHTFTVTFNTVGAENLTATDTVTASITGQATVNVLAAPTATSFYIEAPRYAFSGSPVTVTVFALDQYHHVFKGYAGTVRLSSTTDTLIGLPADYTFVPLADQGEHAFTVTFNTVGAENLTATDTATASITGQATVNVLAAPTATSFYITAPHYAVSGGPVTVTVVVLDQYHQVFKGYAGTVHLSSTTDTLIGVPADYTFVPLTDQGKHAFTVTFNTVGAENITATDTVTASITGQATVNVEAVGAVTHFGVFSGYFAPLGIATPFVVFALDANNHVIAGYTGTVHFTSSLSAALPVDYTFLASDNGRHVFSVTFNTAGTQTLTATDTVTASITGTANVWVLSHLFHW